MKIELDISDEMYIVLLRSLDLYGRLLMGQTSIIKEEFVYNDIGLVFPNQDRTEDEYVLKHLAALHFTNVAGQSIEGFSSHIGIRNTCKNGQRAIDLYTELRMQSGKELEHSVYHPRNASTSYSGETPIIKFKP